MEFYQSIGFFIDLPDLGSRSPGIAFVDAERQRFNTAAIDVAMRLRLRPLGSGTAW